MIMKMMIIIMIKMNGKFAQGVRALGDSLDSLVDREDDSYGEDL